MIYIYMYIYINIYICDKSKRHLTKASNQESAVLVAKRKVVTIKG